MHAQKKKKKKKNTETHVLMNIKRSRTSWVFITRQIESGRQETHFQFNGRKHCYSVTAEHVHKYDNDDSDTSLLLYSSSPPHMADLEDLLPPRYDMWLGINFQPVNINALGYTGCSPTYLLHSQDAGNEAIQTNGEEMESVGSLKKLKLPT
ncbi:hypothetical protein CEXT_227011 [Caerostris extrusa]|uniref:Uncharacterized protein n=1 Tax=Caerostris extrusa TaxID=172846 RepID=A0AAV4XVE0_CAEEX|nr:hypothetical protein CEXT_227011 [Caerostris extrusa]